MDEKCLEIACGEAPYLVSRYDSVTGELIPLAQRIGMLDRKIRVVNKNCPTKEDWDYWTKRAFQSIHGFEIHVDSLFLARENMLATYCLIKDWLTNKVYSFK